MSLLGVLDIGRTALLAQKAAIDVTGENIANVNTPGYSRQTPVLTTTPVDPYQYPPVGTGVMISSIQRTVDRFIQGQINTATSTGGEQSVLQDALNRIEPLFGDLNGSGLGTSLQAFFTAWQDLAMNPQGAAERQAVLSKAQTFLDNLHQINNSLNTVKSDANQSLVATTTSINTMTAQIAVLNEQIRTAELGGGNTNLLRDNRDVLLKSLSQKVGISVLEQTDGTVNVSLLQGPQLVGGKNASTLTLQPDPANGGMYSVILNGPGSAGGTDISPLVAGGSGSNGELGGTLQVRDTLVNSYLANLDELATNLANQVNSVHSAGFGLNGSTGQNLFTAPAAPVPPATFTPGYSRTIALNISNTDSIAAASTDPTLPGGGSGNNITALALADLSGKTLALSSGTNTLNGFYSALVGTVGLAVQSTTQGITQNTALLTQFNNLRESVSGVNLDEELIALTRYQKAYQGAAQLITTGQQMLDTVLNMVQ